MKKQHLFLLGLFFFVASLSAGFLKFALNPIFDFNWMLIFAISAFLSLSLIAFSLHAILAVENALRKELITLQQKPISDEESPKKPKSKRVNPIQLTLQL